MSATTATAAGRTAAEALMLDACTITGKATRPTFNATTGATTPGTGGSVYTGKCKVQMRTGTPATPDAGGEQISTWDLEVHVPMSVTGVDVGALVTITDSLDPALVGRRFRVVNDPAKTYATARRLQCEEVAT